MKVGFGEVVEVKKIRSLGVCRVSVELPLEAYKPAVALLDGERVLIVPSNLQQGFGIIEGSGGENAFSGHVAPEQIAELPEFEEVSGDGSGHTLPAVEACKKQGAAIGHEIDGVFFDELDVPEGEVIKGENHTGYIDTGSGEVLTGGQLARHLDAIGAWRNPDIWRALCSTQAAKDEYRKWIASLPCVACGYQNEEILNHPHHWRELATGGGTSLKPEDYWCIPLAAAAHAAVHSMGSESWCKVHGFTDDEMKATAIGLMAKFNRYHCKKLMKIDSMRDVTPEHIEALSAALGGVRI